MEEYALLLTEKRGLRMDAILLAVGILPVTVVSQSEYSRQISEVRCHIGHRDPDDVDLLALALHFKLPVWSNDRDFEDCRVELLTTEALLRTLRLIR